VNAAWRELAERIRDETADLDRAVRRAELAWDQGKSVASGQDFYLDSVALNLHSFYGGVERVFELVARHVDGLSLSGERWHRDLGQAMAQDLPGRRPAVISGKTARSLDEYRRFRHLVRNVYATNLVPGKMEGLVTGLPDVWETVQQELLAFAAYLDDLSTHDGSA
jgi:hypothetical protein